MNQDQAITPKPLKRTRVSRACNFCRRKKIKCDIDKQYPCSSCVQYSCDCTSNDSPKKRPPPKGYIESLERRLRQMEQLLQTRVPNTGSDDHQQSGNNDGPSSDTHENKVMRHIGISSPYYLMGKQKQEHDRLKHQPEGQTNKDSGHAYDSNQFDQRTVMVSTGHGKNLEVVYDDDNDDMMVIHDEAPKQHLLKQDRSASGLNDILSGNIIKILAQKFIDLRPIILPAIGKRSILESAQNPSLNPLLTSSICSYVAMMLPTDDDTFENYGIDRKDLIQKLAAKENELLRTAFLTPTISNIQALIILCCHPTHISIFTGIWLRTGIAIRMSQDLGLHRSITNASNSKQVRELGKTLWHCVYILDRWSCAVLGRPLAIVDSDCNVDMPLHSIDSNDDSDNIGGSTQEEDEQNHTLFILFIKLSGILGEIQRRIYSPKAKANLGANSASTAQMVDSLQTLLLEWYDQVPVYARLTKEDVARVASPTTAKEEKAALLKTKQWQLGSSLMMCYCAVTILLHRPFIIPDNEILFSPTSAKRCTESAMFATDVARLMNIQSSTHFYWNIMIFSLSVVLSIHMFNCISEEQELSKTARHYLRTLIDVWDLLDSEFPYTPRQGLLSPMTYAIHLLGVKGILPKRSQSLSPAPSAPKSRPTTTNDDTDNTDDDYGNVDQSSAANIDVTTNTHFAETNSQQQQQHQQQPGLQPYHNPAVDPSASIAYLLQENIPTSSSNNGFPATGGIVASNATLPFENQLLDNENWQQIFLNNMGPNPFDFSENKTGDDFWQNNFSLF